MGTQASKITRLKKFRGTIIILLLVLLSGYACPLSNEPFLLFFISSLVILLGTALIIVIQLIRKLNA